MAVIIARHSVFFWIHLYRRIGVSLYPGLPSKTDATTTGLVRQIMEAAFLKYGSLAESDDVKDASLVSEEAILGGWYKKSLEQHGVAELARAMWTARLQGSRPASHGRHEAARGRRCGVDALRHPLA
jgi:hypothetical protein